MVSHDSKTIHEIISHSQSNMICHKLPSVSNLGRSELHNPETCLLYVTVSHFTEESFGHFKFSFLFFFFEMQERVDKHDGN